MTSGKPLAPPFSGSLGFEPSPHSGGYSFISPNLTPDKATGVMYNWDEAGEGAKGHFSRTKLAGLCQAAALRLHQLHHLLGGGISI